MQNSNRNTDLLRTRHQLIKAARNFFDERGYVEVDTPSLVYRPAADAHVDPIAVSGGRYLATSPEIHMKMLLACGLERIYQVCHAFREGESGLWHNPEFTMLEWYSTGCGYTDLMDETEEFVLAMASAAGTRIASPFERLDLRSLFVEKAGWDPFASWNEERFFLDLVDRVEPALMELEAVFVHDYPAQAAAMAKLKDGDENVCERFELYLRGTEIANGYTELRDAGQQERRLRAENEKRKAQGKDPCPIDEAFLDSLRGGLPRCSGIALGLDRLLARLLGLEGIGEVLTFPEWRLK